MKTHEQRLTAEEELTLVGRIKGGDRDARDTLILAHLWLARLIADRYTGPKVPFEDRVQEGVLGLMRASEDFDPAVHGCRFATYAEIWIKAFLHRLVVANGSMIRIPLHVHRERERARRDAVASLGCPPPRREHDVCPDELADRSPDAAGLAGDREQQLLLEAALRRLSPVEAWVLRERFGLTAEVAERSLLVPSSRAAGGLRSGAHPMGDPGDPARRPAYFHRTRAELERDCGLSSCRIRQIEEAALDKLRDVLPRDFLPA